ncbi:L,D-transpeptidase [Salipaludibacillus sp. CF4.18]|uniref:L,D-transpeptidase n=1 Tax=Salipaludibacillus sp. CF4.18 TaxID=3373081 RepID=UPI003EE806DB
MFSIFLAVLYVISPIWPLGENPLVGDPYIIVNTTSHELAFIDDGEVKQQFEVAIGKNGEDTPQGEFTASVKAKNPYYRKMDIPGGDEKNPLGTRWIGFDAKETDGRVYGIHGTNRPSSIGHNVTNGCIRLKNADVEILFEEIPLGTRILVTSSEKSMEELGIENGALSR